MAKSIVTQSDVIAATLARHGVEFVFGLPGGEISAFVCACRRAGLRFVLTGHESSAAIIAQVMGEITGVPGVCAATLGPGATNLATGVANAFLDRSPLLAITAQIPAGAYETMTHQRLALNDLFAPITKRSASADGARTAELICECLALAAAPRPGPVHLSLASDIAIQEARLESAGERHPEDSGRTGQIETVLEKVEAARRPLLLAGLGLPVEAAPALRRLVDALQAPFLVTPKAKGILREDHPLFLGVASGMAIDRDILETLRTADLILAIGFDPVEADKTWFADLNVAALDAV
ncbi:MAG: thiamine pyrophosphate-binding protein [Terriglobia bacterium]